MKFKVFLVLVAVAASVLATTVLAVTPNRHQPPKPLTGPAKVRVTAIVVRSQQHEERLLVAKKIIDAHGQVIGNSFSVCFEVASEGSFGDGVQQCHATFNLPLGKITVSGSRHTFSRYTWVVAGGSGRYLHADGVMNAFQIGDRPRTEQLVFTLSPG